MFHAIGDAALHLVARAGTGVPVAGLFALLNVNCVLYYTVIM